MPLGLEMEIDDCEDVMIQSDEKACLEIFKIVIQNSIDAMEEGKISLAGKSMILGLGHDIR